MNKTLNNIVDNLKDLAGRHTMLEGFGTGDTADIGTNKADGTPLDYPYLHVDYNNTNYAFGSGRGIGFKLYTMTLIVLDKISQDITSTDEIMSDTESILADIVQFVSTDNTMRDFRIQTTTITALPVSDNTKDGTKGWTCELGFKIPYDWCSSALPITVGGSLPVITPADCPEIVDLILQNSLDTELLTIPGNTALYILPDVTHTDTDGSSVVLPAQVPMVCSQLPISYIRDNRRFAPTQNILHDLRWHIQNTTYFNYNSQGLRPVISLTNELELLTLNALNNNLRTTNSLGVQIYDGTDGSLDDYMIEHSSGVGFLLTSPFPNSISWIDANEQVQSLNTLGFSDWRLLTKKDAVNLITGDGANDNLMLTAGSVMDRPFVGLLDSTSPTAVSFWNQSREWASDAFNVTASPTTVFTSTRFFICRNHYN